VPAFKIKDKRYGDLLSSRPVLYVLLIEADNGSRRMAGLKGNCVQITGCPATVSLSSKFAATGKQQCHCSSAEWEGVYRSGEPGDLPLSYFDNAFVD
jgi:hypothetical protein